MERFQVPPLNYMSGWADAATGLPAKDTVTRIKDR